MNRPVRAYQKIQLNYLLTGMVISFVFALAFTWLGSSEFLLSRMEHLINAAEKLLDTPFKVQLLSGALLLISCTPFLIIPSKDYKSLKRLPLLYPMYVLLSGLPYGIHMIITAAISFGMFISNRKNTRNTVFQFLQAWVALLIITLLVELLFSFAKTLLLPVDIILAGEIRRAFLCLDYFIFLVVLMRYAYERRDSYESVFGCANIRRVLDFLVVPRWPEGIQNSKVVKPDIEDLKPIELLFMTIMQPIQLLIVAMIVSVNHRLFVFLILFFAGFLPQRMHKEHTINYHAGNGQEGKWYACLFQTTLTFYVICSAVPSHHLSLLIPAIVGAITWYYMVKFEILLHGKPTVNSAERTDIEAAIAETSFSSDYHRTVCELSWVERKTVREIASIVSYSESQVTKIRERYRKLIERSL